MAARLVLVWQRAGYWYGSAPGIGVAARLVLEWQRAWLKVAWWGTKRLDLTGGFCRKYQGRFLVGPYIRRTVQNLYRK